MAPPSSRARSYKILCVKSLGASHLQCSSLAWPPCPLMDTTRRVRVLSNKPVRAFDCLFEDAGRQIRVLWDDFHRINIAGGRALERCDAFQDWRQCLFDCESMFGFGQGRLLDRSITDYIGERFRVSKMPGGTRKFVYLLEAVERFFLKWPVLVIDIEVRRTHKEEESRGTKPLDWWIDFGKRMVHGKMIFLCCF